MPRVVSVRELKQKAGELVQSVATSQESVVIEEDDRPVAVLSAVTRSLDRRLDLPEWRQWAEQTNPLFVDAIPAPAAARGQPAQTQVDKSLLGFDPTVGHVGSASGREFLVSELERLAVPVSDESLVGQIYTSVLGLCEAKGKVFEEDLRLLAQEAIAEAPQRLKLLSMTVQCTTGVPAMAEVMLELSHGPAMRRAHGDGPLHAAFTAIDKLIGLEPEVENFSVVAATRGQDAIAEASVQLSLEGRLAQGRGVSTDAIEAGVHAYLNALNFLLEGRRTDVAAPQADS